MKKIIVEEIKITVIELVYLNVESKLKLSSYLSENLDYSYKYMSKIFSVATGTTIEQYYIKKRIERVKELLLKEELTLTEIAYLLDYSSIGHLGNQFKKVTGLTATEFVNDNKKEIYEEHKTI